MLACRDEPRLSVVPSGGTCASQFGSLRGFVLSSRTFTDLRRPATSFSSHINSPARVRQESPTAGRRCASQALRPFKLRMVPSVFELTTPEEARGIDVVHCSVTQVKRLINPRRRAFAEVAEVHQVDPVDYRLRNPLAVQPAEVEFGRSADVQEGLSVPWPCLPG